MTDPVGPVGPAARVGIAPSVPDARDDAESERRAIDRRKAERRKSRRKTRSAGGEAPSGEAGRDLVAVGDRISHDPAPPQTPSRPAAAEAAFAAQMLGQGGQKRGLRGGAPVLDAARATYLNAEFTGDRDRRPPVGASGKTEI